MNRFWSECRGWALRGTLCALPSFVWACAFGFDGIDRILIMLTVVALFVAGFAWASVSLAEKGWNDFVRAVKAAAWVKIVLSIFNVGLGMPDLWLGMGSVSLISHLNGSAQDWAVGGSFSPGWTAAITVAQGGLIALLIVAVATGVLGGQRVFRRCARRASAV